MLRHTNPGHAGANLVVVSLTSGQGHGALHDHRLPEEQPCLIETLKVLLSGTRKALVLTSESDGCTGCLAYCLVV